MDIILGLVLNPQFIETWSWLVGLHLFLLSLAAGSLMLFKLHSLRHWPTRARPGGLPLWVDLLAPVSIGGVALLALDLGPRLPAMSFTFVLEPGVLAWGRGWSCSLSSRVARACASGRRSAAGVWAAGLRLPSTTSVAFC